MKVVLCNCPGDAAQGIARALVERAGAACVNIIPAVQSVYRWDGETCVETESTLLIKVALSQLDALKVFLLELHPYDVPEIVALDVDAEGSSAAYVDWVRAAATT